MKLTELKPQFLRYSKEGNRETYLHVDTMQEADGVMFLCPKCFQANGNSSVGTHRVMCWFRGKVSDEVKPNPGRWTPGGTGFEDLTFVPGEPPMAVSVALTSDCGWHGFIGLSIPGEVTTC